MGSLVECIPLWLCFDCEFTVYNNADEDVILRQLVIEGGKEDANYML